MQNQIMSNAASGDVYVIGIELTFYRVSIIQSFFMHVLVPGKTFYGHHAFHPKVICISADDMKCTFESDFNFKSKTIGFDDEKGVEVKIRTHKYDFPTSRMIDQYETHQAFRSFPNEVYSVVADRNFVFV